MRLRKFLNDRPVSKKLLSIALSAVMAFGILSTSVAYTTTTTPLEVVVTPSSITVEPAYR